MLNTNIYFKFRLSVFLLACFLFSANCFSQLEEEQDNDDDVENVVIEKRLLIFHQYMAEHSFIDLGHVDNGLKVRVYPTISLPVFGLGFRYKINDHLFIGAQSTFGISRDNMSISTTKNNTKNNYTIETLSYRRTISLGLVLDKQKTLSILFGDMASAHMEAYKLNGEVYKDITIIFNDSYNTHLGVEYEYKPFEDKKIKFSGNLSVR